MTNIKRAWLVPFFVLLLVSAAGLGMPAPPSAVPKGGPIVAGDVAWMITATAFVLLMTPGLSFFYGGMVQRKNLISTMLQSVITMGVISILWVVVGFSLAFGESFHGIIGNPMTFLMFRGVGGATHPDLAPTIPLALYAMFQLKFAIIAPALTTGSFAERVRFSSYLLFMVLFSVFIYCPLAHMTWHPQGFLRQWGVLDFAGGTVVHMSAGFGAFTGAIMLGRRAIHKQHGSHVPANIPYVMLGTGLLWFGWFGFNAGSALAANDIAVTAFVNTNTASAAAMLAWVLLDAVKGGKVTALGASIGAVVGLVSITPAAGFVTVGHSIVIGTITGIACNSIAHWRSKTTIDDTLDVFPCHGMGGVIGMICTGIFAEKVGLIYGPTTTFLHHLGALVIVGVFSIGGTFLLYKIADSIIPLRVSEEEERMGLDLTQHNESVDELGVLLPMTPRKDDGTA